MQTKNTFLRGGFMGGLCLLVCVLLALSHQKLKKIGLNIEYAPTANVGEEVRFLFTAGDNVQSIRIFSDKGSLGMVKIDQNRAEFSFSFGFPSTKKMRFVGISSTNDTVSVAYGEITITGKSLGNVVIIQNEPNTGFATITDELDILKPTYPLPTTNLRFNPTPFENSFNGKIKTFTALPSDTQRSKKLVNF